jgi:hypothetical protein
MNVPAQGIAAATGMMGSAKRAGRERLGAGRGLDGVDASRDFG